MSSVQNITPFLLLSVEPKFERKIVKSQINNLILSLEILKKDTILFL